LRPSERQDGLDAARVLLDKFAEAAVIMEPEAGGRLSPERLALASMA
jgi:hypothetical protein